MALKTWKRLTKDEKSAYADSTLVKGALITLFGLMWMYTKQIELAVVLIGLLILFKGILKKIR